MNKWEGIGRLVRDVNLESTTSGKTYFKNAIAIDRKGEGTDFIPVIAWEKTAEFIGKYFKKGSRIGIVGRIQSSSYKDKEGKNHTSIDAVIEEVTFCESKTTEDVLLSNKSDNFLSVPDGLIDELPFS